MLLPALSRQRLQFEYTWLIPLIHNFVLLGAPSTGLLFAVNVRVQSAGIRTSVIPGLVDWMNFLVVTPAANLI
jgi:hypothetical protein